MKKQKLNMYSANKNQDLRRLHNFYFDELERFRIQRWTFLQLFFEILVQISPSKMTENFYKKGKGTPSSQHLSATANFSLSAREA